MAADEPTVPGRAERVPIRDDLAGTRPYGAPQLDVKVRLNTNETAEPPGQAYLDAVAATVRSLELHRYPDRPATALRRRLGERFDLPIERVWAANGSNEVLLQIFQAYGGPGRRLLLFRPGYSAHPLIATVAGTEVVTHDLPDDFTLTPELAADAVERHRPDIVCIASPNNPSGVVTGHAAVRALHDTGGALVIVDEAYVEFAGEDTSASVLLDELPRLVVTRTFSKAFRLAGLRLGYLLAHDWVIDDLRIVRLPYHLDALKQAAALAALDHRDVLLDHIPRVVAERERLVAGLEQLDAVRVWPSAGNFLLLRTPVTDLFDRLLARDVLVRDFSRQPRLDRCVRVTIGTPEENDALQTALRAVLDDHEEQRP